MFPPNELIGRINFTHGKDRWEGLMTIEYVEWVIKYMDYRITIEYIIALSVHDV